MTKYLFETACFPNLHECTEDAQEAGRVIRREIQRRYAYWQMKERSRHLEERHAEHQAGKYAAWGREYSPAPFSADTAKNAYDVLERAYFAWARTSSPVPDLTADRRAQLEAVLHGTQST